MELKQSGTSQPPLMGRVYAMGLVGQYKLSSSQSRLTSPRLRTSDYDSFNSISGPWIMFQEFISVTVALKSMSGRRFSYKLGFEQIRINNSWYAQTTFFHSDFQRHIKDQDLPYSRKFSWDKFLANFSISS